ncbi:MAG: hypothetical protein ABS76_32520 [Pelagibacterium sp. SCN 64-44]|nr:MAG: hypothetical protein ABS76_32520 [Pelagibacterium sp. SCN 64-44]
MVEKKIKIPGPDHPIAIEPNPGRVRVMLDGVVIADTRDALTLRESKYGPVQYIPRQDVRMDLLVRSTHETHCAYKGDASYYSIPMGGERATDAVWSYENPYDAVAPIKGRLAFYPDRVDSIVVED